jgi:hypothetical protein
MLKLAALILAICCCCHAGPAAAEMLSLSLAPPGLVKGERIVGFQVTVVGGRIASLPAIPAGWNITIKNDPSWRTTISGAIIIGAAALDTDSFHDFMVIEKYEAEDIKFDLTAEIEATKDFETNRRMPLKAKDLHLRKKI